MNAEQLRALARLLDYVAGEERKHFEATPPEERDIHIYLDIQILQNYLDQQQGDNS